MSHQAFSSFTTPTQNSSYISLKTLTLTPGLLAPDIWTPTSPPSTQCKLQPASLTLHLKLTSSASESWRAAERDEVDSTTVHYGVLAKAVRKSVTGEVRFEDVFGVVKGVVGREGEGAVEGFIVEVRLGKAGMFADGGIVAAWDGRGRWVVKVEGMRVMCLIGVNGNERRARQPVDGSVWIYYEGEEGGLKGVIGVEQVLAGIMEETEFETLESLAEFAVEEVTERLLRRVLEGREAWVQLRLEKPRAVAFADAPAIEVVRRVESQGRQKRRVELAVVKPYIG